MGATTPRRRSAIVRALDLTRNKHDQKRGNDVERSQLDHLNKGKVSRIETNKTRQRNGGDANGAVRCGHAIGKQAQQHSRDGSKAQACKHARRDGDGGAKARHALHKAAKAPGDEQRQQTTVARDRGDHAADNIHSARLDAQVIGKDRGDDNKDDGPQGHEETLEACGGNLTGRKLPHP